MRRAIILLLACCLLAPASAGARSKRESARELFREGNRLHDAKRYGRALRAFYRARALYPSYKIDLNIANTLYEMGRRAAAANALDLFLERAPAAAPRSILASARRRLTALRRRLASLRVLSAVRATISLNGKEMGRTGARRIYLRPGRYRLVVARRGYWPFESEFILAAGQHQQARVKLQRRETGFVAPPRRERPRPRQRRDRGSARQIWAYATLGLGVALGVSAAVLYGVGKSQGDAAHEDYLAARDQPRIDVEWEKVVSAERKLIAGHVLAGVAAAALSVSIYLFATRPSAAKRRRDATAAPRLAGGVAPIAGGAIVSWGGWFP